MISQAIFPNVVNYLERGLDASSLRNTVLANNLANVDTPGFKRSDVSFEGLLEQETQKAGKLSTQPWKPQVVVDTNTSTRQDGNNVDVDAEMTNLAENSIYYEALIQQLTSQFSMLRTAITEGRR